MSNASDIIAGQLQQQVTDRANFTDYQSKINFSGAENQREYDEGKLRSLMDFSSTLSGHLVHRETERIKKEIDESTALAREQEIEKGEEAIEAEIKKQPKINPTEHTPNPWSMEEINKKFGNGKEIAISSFNGTNIFGLPEEEIEEHEKGVEELKKNKSITDEAALNTLNSGGTFENSEDIKNLSGWGLYAFTAEKARIAGEQYKDYIKGALTRDDIIFKGYDEDGRAYTFTPATADTEEEKRQAMNWLRKQYMIDNNLLGVNRVLLSKYFYKEAIVANHAELNDWREVQAIEKSQRIRENASNTFTRDLDFKSLIDTFATTVDGQGNLLGRSGALDEAFKLMKANMDLGIITPEAYNNIKNQSIIITDHNGNKQKVIVGKHWKRRFLKLDEDYITAQADNEKLEQLQFTTAGLAVRNDFQRYSRSKGGNLSDNELNDWSEKWQLATGLEWEPDFIKNFRSLQDRDDEADLERLTNLRRARGFLIPADIENVSNNVYDKVDKWVKSDEDIAKLYEKYDKKSESQITEWTNFAFKTTGLNKNQAKGKWNSVKLNALAFYETERDNAIADGEKPNTAHKIAMSATRDEFGLWDKKGDLKSGIGNALYKSSFYTKDPYDLSNVNELSKVDQFIINSGENAIHKLGNGKLFGYTSQKDKLNYLSNNVLPGMGEIDQLGSPLNEALIASIGDKEVPHVFTAIARPFKDLTGWDIADAQLKAAGIEEGFGVKPPAYELLSSPENNDILTLLNSNTNQVKQSQAKVVLEDINQNINAEALNYTGPVISPYFTDESLFAEGVESPFSGLNITAGPAHAAKGLVEERKAAIVNQIGPKPEPPKVKGKGPYRTAMNEYRKALAEWKLKAEEIEQGYRSERKGTPRPTEGKFDSPQFQGIPVDIRTRRSSSKARGRELFNITEYLVDGNWTETLPENLEDNVAGSIEVSDDSKVKFYTDMYGFTYNPKYLERAYQFSSK